MSNNFKYEEIREFVNNNLGKTITPADAAEMADVSISYADGVFRYCAKETNTERIHTKDKGTAYVFWQKITEETIRNYLNTFKKTTSVYHQNKMARIQDIKMGLRDIHKLAILHELTGQEIQSIFLTGLIEYLSQPDEVTK